MIAPINTDQLKVFVIWTPRYPGDNRKRAVAAAGIVPDSRATHFWDANGYLPREYGGILDLPEGDQFAWDTYMVFGRGTEWNHALPRPHNWMHQMSKSLGRDDPRWLDGDEFAKTVARMVSE
ncbi:MAG: hypothetical protein DWQ31_17345 [Planctomycetota bacterium]|nr:MAG: hypothetical protein DWQ31_17345 [Planctomycetota bacterium]REJ92117.1 MAG: hypothetical protein DWQ35_13295 [Planctomycetota bacterium]REK28653.1 MAG: hypothetical protein DWQ42_04885 [Planctomycetota bacterium]REK39267.1 MAG: hypothetical protein DWQ46_18465 [Planctomycetota bacterium]